LAEELVESGLGLLHFYIMYLEFTKNKEEIFERFKSITCTREDIACIKIAALIHYELSDHEGLLLPRHIEYSKKREGNEPKMELFGEEITVEETEMIHYGVFESNSDCIKIAEKYMEMVLFLEKNY